MTKPRCLPILVALLLGAGSAHAADVSWHGYVDFRVAVPADEEDWSDGGLGKTRFGGSDFAGSGGAVLAGDFQLAPSLLASAELQYLPDQRHPLDIIDAWLRYRPVSTTRWRWSLKGGAFFAPISLENNGIGWTSTWTLTPSAINSWVGEELRTFGAEARIEHRGDVGMFEAYAAAFGRNDTAGELIAARGWALGDLTSGINASLREPDVLAPLIGAPVPVLFRPFTEIDHHVGWYAGVDWNTPGDGRLSVLRYDNRADATLEEDYAGREVYAWRTKFWSVGAQGRIGDVVLLAQAMDGSTVFEPVPGFVLDSRIHAGYVLAGWDRGEWRPAVRVDLFGVRQLPEWLPNPLSEHGNAITAALNWRPRDWLRVTGEWLRVDSTRDQRRLEGLAPRQLDTQVQLSVRLLY